MMIWLKAYLLAGMVLHKATWELLKRRAGMQRTTSQSHSSRQIAMKTVKVIILIGLLAQVFMPDILPIQNEASQLRAVGVIIYSLGLVTAMLGRLQLGDNWTDIEAARVLTEHQVVSNGLYRFIRHPIYVGDLLLVIGLQLCLNSLLVLVALCLVPPVLWRAVREEQMLVRRLPGYAEYCRRTKRFVPYVV